MRKPVFAAAVAVLATIAVSCLQDQIEQTDLPITDNTETSLTDPDLAWSANTCEATMFADNEFPTLSNEHGVSVSYSSSEPSVATIGSDGSVSLVAAGSTVITASSDEDDTYEASSATYTLTVARAQSGLAWSQDSAEVVFGEDATLPTLSNPGGLSVSYASSDTAVATVASDGTVSITAAGVTTITASNEQTDQYEAGSDSYTLTVSKSSYSISWSSSSVTVELGSTAELPTLSNPGGLVVTYSSSNTDVATIDASGGAVTIVGAGVTTITAYAEATQTTEEASTFYTLTVTTPESKQTDPGLAWSSSTYKATMGDTSGFPTLSCPAGLTIEYSSSRETVATISSDGTVTLVGAGTTTITATSAETEEYYAGSASYTLTVSRATATLSWSASTCSATLGEDNILPTLNNPSGLEVQYSSSDTSVATVSSDGTVTLVGAGSTTITAASSATSVYSAASASYKLTVSKAGVTLSWSASSCSAVLGETNEYPTLSNPSGVSVEYSSSNTGVASVSSGGEVTPVAAGTTVITAAFAGNDYYNAASASYTLTVTAEADDGAGTFTYASTGDTSSGDDVSNTTFTRKITVTYSTSGSATVAGDYYGYATVSGNDVTINNTGSEFIVYELSGTTSDGFFKLYSNKKQAILLNGVSITNKAGAAINNQSKKRTFVMVQGSNSLADGSSYTDTPSDEDEKAAFFSEGQLVFSGSGSLTVTAKGKAAITSDDYIRVMNAPTITATSSAGHAVRGKEFIQIDNGTITASTSANMKKGFTSDSLVVFNGGTTKISVTGGAAYDSDDGEYTSSAGVKADKLFYMNSGSLTITNSGSGGKGINVGSSDTTNDCKAYFNGGTIDITCTGAYYSSGDGSSSKGIKVGKKFEASSSSSTKAGGGPGGGGSGPGGGGSSSSYTYTGDMYVTGGKITVNCTGSASGDSGNEGIESKGVLEVTGGEIFAYSSSDDAINAADDFTISGGYVGGLSTANDGLDANGNFYISGGVVYATSTKSPEVGIDANTEESKKLYVSGGVLFVQGGLESGSSLTQSCYSTSSFSKNTWYGLTVGSTTYAFKTSSASGTPLVVSGSSKPTLKSGVTTSGGTSIFDGYGIYGCTVSGGSTVSLSSYSK